MKTAIFLVARAGSTRLPQKMMAPVAGRSVLRLHLDRLASVKNVNGIVLCTTTDDADDVLAAECEGVGAVCYRGDPEDVPARLLGAAKFFQADAFALVEGDEVFTDPDYVTQAIFAIQNGTADLVKVDNLPIGSWVYAMRTDALERLCEIKGPGAVDGWSRYFYDANNFRVESIQPDPALPAFDEELRLTMDYPEDLALIQAIADRLSSRGLPIRLKPALEVLNEQPELLEINRHLNDTYWQRVKAMPLPQQGDR